MEEKGRERRAGGCVTPSFLAAWSQTVGREGGYSSNPSDPGGATKYGITARVAHNNGYRGKMEDLTKDQARTIAKRAYWDVLRLDEVALLSSCVAFELFDTSYNCGTLTAGRFLQTALNSLNRRGADYPDLVVDGVIGKNTIGALSDYLHIRAKDGELVLVRVLNCLQGARYIQVSGRNEALETFVFGWFLNRVV